jgi:hypothetical protein
LRAGASVRRNDDNGQGDKFHGRFHGGSPISAWLRRCETSSRPLNRFVPRQSRPVLKPCCANAGGNCACQPTARRSSTRDRPSPRPGYRRCHLLRSSR